MSARFRYVAADGREVQIATTDDLVRAFASGSLGKDTLLYDAYGGGWAPARNHSALLGKELTDLAFTLTEAAPEATDEVVAKLLRERAAAADSASEARERNAADGLVTEALGASLFVPSESRLPSTARTEPSSYPGGSVPESSRFLEEQGASRVSVSADRPRQQVVAAATLRPAERGDRALSLDRPRRLMGTMGAVVSALGGLSAVVFVFFLLGDPSAGGASGAPAQAVRDAAVAAGFGGPARTGASELTLAEDRALEDMVTEMERQQGVYRVDQVPSLWLEGVYLAEATRFPDVESFWERYAAYVKAMRESEGELFRRSLVARLESGGLSETQISMRVARALRTFNADFGRREAVYDAMLELSAAALDLHDFLVDNERRISYAPAAGGVSREPITEAVAETRELTEEMNRALDRLLAALEATHGNRIAPRDEIAQGMMRGLVDDEVSPMN